MADDFLSPELLQALGIDGVIADLPNTGGYTVPWALMRLPNGSCWVRLQAGYSLVPNERSTFKIGRTASGGYFIAPTAEEWASIPRLGMRPGAMPTASVVVL